MPTMNLSVLLSAAALFCVGGGCTRDSVIELNISGFRSEVTLLRVRALLDSRASLPASQTLRGDTSSLLIQVPPEKTGELLLYVDGLRDVSCVKARGVGSIHMDGPGYYQMAIELHGQPIGCLLAEDFAEELDGVWGSGPDDVWAVGPLGRALHWDGFTWASVPASANVSFYGVWGSGPSDIWAVGTDNERYLGAIQHWEGHAWIAVPSGGAGSLSDIWGSKPTDIWAVGRQIMHWDGAVWAPAVPESTYGHSDVWGSGPNDVWTVSVGGTIYHWNGAIWSFAFSLPPSRALFSVWGSGPDDVWAVGGNYYAADEQRDFAHWNGTSWVSFTDAGNSGFIDVWGSGPDDFWAVDAGGALARWNGTAWTSSSEETLFKKIWGSGPNDIWAVGSDGIHHWNGARWERRN